MGWWKRIQLGAVVLLGAGMLGAVLWCASTATTETVFDRHPVLRIKDKGVTEGGRRVWILEHPETGREFIVGEKEWDR